VQSLLFQYQERGGLSKKQLQVYMTKPQNKSIPVNKLATLEAVILKKNQTKYKSHYPRRADLSKE